jgi:hypothetical protein
VEVKRYLDTKVTVSTKVPGGTTIFETTRIQKSFVLEVPKTLEE